MRVLAHHDRRRQKSQRNANSQGEGSASEVGPSDQALASRSTRSLRDRLKPIYHEKDAELVLELVNCRKKLNFKETSDEHSEPPTKRARREDIPCFAYLAIWDNREGYQSQDPLVKVSRKCMLQPYESTNGALAVNITMDDPFKIEARELFVPVKHQGSEGMMVGDKYIMEIKIIPTSSTELWPPIPILNKSEGSLNPDGSKRVNGSMQGYLVSNYLNLPFAPADDVPLSVSFDQGGRTYKTKYGFEVSSIWEASQSPLEQSIKKEEGEGESQAWYQRTPAENEASKPKRKAKAVRKPPPVAVTHRTVHLNDTVHVKPKTTIYYIFEPLLPRIETTFPGFKSCRVEGYWCPTCRTEFITLRQLHFHLTSNHSKFNFFVDKEEKPEDSNLPARVTIRVEEAEIFRERASNDVLDPREMSWVSPNKPLDVDAYLNGDHRWLGGPYRKKKVPKPPSEKVKKIWEPPKFRDPTDVPNLPIRPLAKHPVPQPKTATETPFYKSISHKLVDFGEAVSESDDEIDQSWLKHKHRSKLTEHRTDWFENDIQRRLRIAFDEHLMDERFPNTRYVSDAFVRFLRKMDSEEWLWQSQGRLEVVNMCCEMMKDGLMNENVFMGITEFMNQRSQRCNRKAETSPYIEDSVVPTTSELDRPTGVTSEINATSESPYVMTPNTPEAQPEGPKLDPDMYGVCGICCKMITRKKQIISCVRGDCSHGWRTYHFVCGGLMNPSKDWTCSACLAQDATEKPRSQPVQGPLEMTKETPIPHRHDQSQLSDPLREPPLSHQVGAPRFEPSRERPSMKRPPSKDDWLFLPRVPSLDYALLTGQRTFRSKKSTPKKSTKHPPPLYWHYPKGQDRNSGANGPLDPETIVTREASQVVNSPRPTDTSTISPIRLDPQLNPQAQLSSTLDKSATKTFPPADFVDLTQDDPPSPTPPRPSLSVPHRRAPDSIRKYDDHEDDDLIELPATMPRPKPNLNGLNDARTASITPSLSTTNKPSPQRSAPRSSSLQDPAQNHSTTTNTTHGSRPRPEIITLDGTASPLTSPSRSPAPGRNASGNIINNNNNHVADDPRPWEGRIFSVHELMRQHLPPVSPPPPPRRRSGRGREEPMIA